tara:strand:- start:1049 stop:3448 length:2400 start_codon:yes stop_codon:yes gene_type:complete
MANLVSPGVYTIEKDVSDFAPSVNPSIVGLVGFASRGPVNKPTLLTSPADLIRTFGTPDLVTGGQGIFGALQVLQKTNQVYYVRAATTDAKASNNVFSLASAPHAALNVSAMNPDYVYRFDMQAFDKAGSQLGNETSVYAYRERPYVSGTAGGSIYPTTPFANWGPTDWHNAVIAGFGQAFDVNNGQLQYIPSGYAATSGMVVGREAGGTTTNAASFTAKTYFASGVTYTGNYLSATPIDINDLTFIRAETVSTAGHGASGYTHVWNGVAGPEDNFLGGTSAGAKVTAASSTMTLNANAPSGATLLVSGSQGGYQLASLYPGLGYNYSAINYTAGLQYRGLRYVVNQTNNDGRFDVLVQSDGGTEESYTMSMTKPGNSVSATSLYPEDVLTRGLDNSVSDYVKGNFFTLDSTTFSTGVNPASTAFSATVSGVGPFAVPTTFGGSMTAETPWTGGTYSSSGFTPENAAYAAIGTTWRCITLEDTTLDSKGGVNGDAGSYGGNMTNANVTNALVGTTGAKTGVYALDSEDTPVTIAAVPGVSQQSVQNALITLAENTQNFLAVVSPPVGFGNAQQAIEWSNGNADGRTAAINSSYAAVYWPWVKQFDAYTGADRWYDPSIYAIGQMCFTDEVADPWFAPAGLSRGRLTQPIDVEVKLNQGDRDALYGPGNIVNPITKFNTDGIVIYGQRTGQRAPTALDRINVRRLMIFLRRMVLQSTRRFVFEPNDPVTWEAVRSVINPALADIQQRRGITAFQTVCDSTTNTPLRVDRNELWCKIILKPTKTAEILVFELNLTNQSASV